MLCHTATSLQLAIELVIETEIRPDKLNLVWLDPLRIQNTSASWLSLEFGDVLVLPDDLREILDHALAVRGQTLE